MSRSSIYLRDQGPNKCRSHADALGNAETQAELRKLADHYVVQAEELDRKENEALG